MRSKSSIEAAVEAPGRSPKPGVAGSNPAGGTQKSGILGELPIDISVSFARLVVLFHCTFHCTRDRGSNPFGAHGG
jgi:hypothetical protein